MGRFLLLTWMITGGWALAAVSAGPAEDLLQDAQLAMFDGRWADALDKLRQIRGDGSAGEQVRTSALFYEARALENLGREDQALPVYETFLGRSRTDNTLSREARYSTVRLAVELYRSGNKSFINRALTALDSSDKSLRLMAAIQLSYVSDQSLRQKAVPVLKQILREDGDSEAHNQATLALLRIDPRLLEKESPASGPKRARSIHVVFTGSTGDEFRLNLPVSLARLFVASLPDEAKKTLSDTGLRLDKLVEELSKAGEVIEVKTDDGLVRIWVD